VSRLINDTQVQEMPVNGRNFASLLGLQTGVVQEFAFNSNRTMDMFATQGTHVNGLRGDANNLQIEGSPSTRTRANGAMVAPPSIDAIGEINIVTTGYMPEYSRAAVGVLGVAQKADPNVQVSALVPYRGLGSVSVALNDSSSRYDSLQVSVQRRLNQRVAIWSGIHPFQFLRFGLFHLWERS
jgi:hypothetical protein